MRAGNVYRSSPAVEILIEKSFFFQVRSRLKTSPFGYVRLVAANNTDCPGTAPQNRRCRTCNAQGAVGGWQRRNRAFSRNLKRDTIDPIHNGASAQRRAHRSNPARDTKEVMM